MKKRNIKKVPKYAFGAKEITGLISAGGNIAQGFNTGNQTANAAFSGLDTVGNMLPGVAGMAVKGVAGLGKMITGIVGTKGSVDQATGEITEGSGILGRRNRNKLRQQSGVIKNSIAAAQNSQHLAADYYSENGYNDLTMSKGGIVPNTLAYLDDGELIRTPNGEISQIPEQGKPTDSNLVNVPVGTQVLSDKLKVPGTNATFAQVGKKYMKTGKKKGNDVYAQNSQMLNERNNQKKYNELLALQEQVKAKRSIKNKVGKYVLGTPGLPEPTTSAEDRDEMTKDGDELNELFIRVNPNYNPNIQHSKDRATTSWYKSADKKAYQQAGNAVRSFLKNKTNYDNAYTALSNLPQIQKNLKAGMSFEDAVVKNVQDGLYGQVHDYFDISSTPFTHGETNSAAPVRSRSSVLHNIVVPISGQGYMVQNKVGDYDFTNNYIYTGPGKINIPRNNTDYDNTDNSNNPYDILGNIISNSAALISPIANMTVKDSESSVPYTYTPKYGPTDWNISPILDEINRTNAIARYNQSQLSPNTGAGLAFGIQSAVARNNAIARAYAEKNNMENQMAMQNAGIYNDAARYNTQALHTAAVENAQNRAAARTIRNTGLSQLSTALQSMARDNRLNSRDQALLEYMRDFFNYGSTQDTVNKLYRNFR